MQTRVWVLTKHEKHVDLAINTHTYISPFEYFFIKTFCMHLYCKETSNLWVRGPSKVQYREARAFQLLHTCLSKHSYCNCLLSSLLSPFYSYSAHSLDCRCKIVFFYYFNQKITCDVNFVFLSAKTKFAASRFTHQSCILVFRVQVLDFKIGNTLSTVFFSF